MIENHKVMFELYAQVEKDVFDVKIYLGNDPSFVLRMFWSQTPAAHASLGK
jgi:hypothetical protein